MGGGCSKCGRCWKNCRGKKRRETVKATSGVRTEVSGGEIVDGHRIGVVKVIVMKDQFSPRSAVMTPEWQPPADDDGMLTPVSSFHNPGDENRLNRENLSRHGGRQPSAIVNFDVCSVDRESFTEISVVSSSDSEVDGAVNMRQPSRVLAPEPSMGGTESQVPAGGGAAGAAGGTASNDASPSKAPNAAELDTKTLTYVMSRIFASTYHSPAMCLLNLNTRSDASALNSRELSNSVMVSPTFAQVVFGKPKATGNEVLGWLLGKVDCPHPSTVFPPTEPFQPLSPRLSPDDQIFLQDQRRILKRLLMKPRPKGKLHHVEDRDSDFDDSDSEYDPEQDLHQRTLEEGFCHLLLPRPVGGDDDDRDGGRHAPVIATLYISTIASQVLPADMRGFMKGGTPLLAVVSVVGTRALDEASMSFIPNEIATFPDSACTIHDLASGSVFRPNEAPCFIRSSHFTGNVFCKTVTDPAPDPRIQPYFEGKNRKFEIQIQGRFTPPAGIDLNEGTIGFGVYLEDKLGGPGGKPLTWMQSAMIGSIIGAFKMIARGGLNVMTGNEGPEAHPMMGIPLLTFLDRLSLRGNLEGSEMPPKKGEEPEDGGSKKKHKSPPLALGVAMLPETPELKALQKHADKERERLKKEAKKEHKSKHGIEPNLFKSRETTYTMSFHSQYIDFECWMMRKVPGFNNLDLHTYWGNQHPIISVVWVPHGVPFTELRTKGVFLLQMQARHTSNLVAAGGPGTEPAV